MQGDYAPAFAVLEEGLSLYREIGEPQGIALTLCQLAGVTTSHRDYTRARELYAESLERFRDLGALWGVAYCLDGFAMVAIAEAPAAPLATEQFRANYQEQARRSARMWGAAEALRETIGFHLSPVDRSIYRDYLEAGRTIFGEASWAAAWAEGRALTLDQAIAEALRCTDEPEARAKAAHMS